MSGVERPERPYSTEAAKQADLVRRFDELVPTDLVHALRHDAHTAPPQRRLRLKALADGIESGDFKLYPTPSTAARIDGGYGGELDSSIAHRPDGQHDADGDQHAADIELVRNALRFGADQPGTCPACAARARELVEVAESALVATLFGDSEQAIREKWRRHDAELTERSTWADEWQSFPYGAAEHSNLVAVLHAGGLLYALNALALHPFGLALAVVRDDDEGKVYGGLAIAHTRDPEGTAFDELGHSEGVAKLGDRELSVLVANVREVEARLTRELERRKPMRTGLRTNALIIGLIAAEPELTVADIVHRSALPPHEVTDALERLVDVGAIELNSTGGLPTYSLPAQPHGA